MTTTATEYTLELPLPPSCLRPNSRAHWGTKAREASVYAARVWAEFGVKYGLRRYARWEHAVLTIEVTWPDARQWDDDAMVAALKSARDVFTTAPVARSPRARIGPRLGIIQDDSYRHLTVAPVVMAIDRSLKAPVVRLTLRKGEVPS